jgi:hypothetical protein
MGRKSKELLLVYQIDRALTIFWVAGKFEPLRTPKNTGLQLARTALRAQRVYNRAKKKKDAHGVLFRIE